jgi:hypothetical protein
MVKNNSEEEEVVFVKMEAEQPARCHLGGPQMFIRVKVM